MLKLRDVVQITVNFEKLTVAEKSRVPLYIYLCAVALVSYEANYHQQTKHAAFIASTPVASALKEAAGEVAFHGEKNTQSKN